MAIDLVSSEATLKQLWQIDGEEYQDSNVPFSSFLRWWKRYDLGLRIVTNESACIVGGVGIWPISEPQTRALIAGTLPESSLLPVRCETLDVIPSQWWYISGIFTRHGEGLNTPLRRLLKTGVGSWANSHHIRYPLYCYALGYSKQGVALLERFKFECIKTSAEAADGLPLYVREFKTLAELRSSLI